MKRSYNLRWLQCRDLDYLTDICSAPPIDGLSLQSGNTCIMMGSNILVMAGLFYSRAASLKYPLIASFFTEILPYSTVSHDIALIVV